MKKFLPMALAVLFSISLFFSGAAWAGKPTQQAQQPKAKPRQQAQRQQPRQAQPGQQARPQQNPGMNRGGQPGIRGNQSNQGRFDNQANHGTGGRFSGQANQGTGKSGGNTGQADRRFTNQGTGKSGGKSSAQGAGKTKNKQADTGKSATGKSKSAEAGKEATGKSDPGSDKVSGHNQPATGKSPAENKADGHKLNKPNKAELAKKMKEPHSPEDLHAARMKQKAARSKFEKEPKRHELTERERSMVSRSVESTSSSTESYAYSSDAYYEEYGFDPPPWCLQLAPYYGVWDTKYLAFMVANGSAVESSLFYYNHRGETELIAWRDEMNQLAEQNPELAAQLATLDEQAQLLAAQNIPVNPDYVPDAPVWAPEIVLQLTVQVLQQ